MVSDGLDDTRRKLFFMGKSIIWIHYKLITYQQKSYNTKSFILYIYLIYLYFCHIIILHDPFHTPTHWHIEVSCPSHLDRYRKWPERRDMFPTVFIYVHTRTEEWVSVNNWAEGSMSNRRTTLYRWYWYLILLILSLVIVLESLGSCCLKFSSENAVCQ